jgi:hypothetical protein
MCYLQVQALKSQHTNKSFPVEKFHSLPITVNTLKSRRMRCMGNVSRMEKMSNAHKILIKIPDRKKQLARTWRRWEDSTKICLRVLCENVDYSHLTQKRISGRLV